MTVPAHWPTAFRIDPAKIVDYLLDPTHPDGGSKCEFLRPFGFVQYPGNLLSAIDMHRQPDNFVCFVKGYQAFKLHFHGPLISPSTIDNPNVRTVWQVDDADPARIARFITLKPLPKLLPRQPPPGG
ncbi:DUF6883 domain-containing protein [uncultured Methylobacterium sp.]|uniref:DUF6883 domain-containing protein n=1 Tax=uncultured Methylobacterium sp. TaxID=157278 RepID=UPI0035C959CB